MIIRPNSVYCKVFLISDDYLYVDVEYPDLRYRQTRTYRNLLSQKI